MRALARHDSNKHCARAVRGVSAVATTRDVGGDSRGARLL